jgi:hypothetical protein
LLNVIGMFIIVICMMCWLLWISVTEVWVFIPKKYLIFVFVVSCVVMTTSLYTYFKVPHFESCWQKKSILFIFFYGECWSSAPNTPWFLPQSFISNHPIFAWCCMCERADCRSVNQGTERVITPHPLPPM